MKSIVSSFQLLIAFSLLLISHNAFARWRTPDEADALKLNYEVKVFVKKDGTAVTREKTTWKILTKAGIEDFGTFVDSYDASSKRVAILSASITTNNKKTIVDKKHIENKPKSSNNSGFDSVNRIVVAYPGVEIGSIVELELEEVIFEPKLKNHYSDLFAFGLYPSSAGQTISIESEVSLRHLVSGPTGYLRVTSGRKGEHYTLNASLIKDSYFESNSNTGKFEVYTPDALAPVLRVTTEESWNSLVNKLVPTYEKAWNEELPAVFNPILQSAKKESGFVAQANVIHNGISEAIRYMGDWRASENSLFPRSLKEIAETKFGDCKDMSLLMTVMLRKLGYQASPVAVERQSNTYLPTEIPSNRYFDHMIVRVELSPSQVHWIDPTRSIAFSDGVWRDLGGRRTLVVRSGVTGLEGIPQIKAEENLLDVKIDVLQETTSDVTYNITVMLSSVFGGNFTSAMRSKSKKEQTESIKEILAGGEGYEELEIQPFDLNLKHAQQVQLSGKVKKKHAQLVTSAGIVRSISDLPNTLKGVVKIVPEKMDTGIDFGTPEFENSVYTLSADGLVDGLPESCAIDSPWASAKKLFAIKNGRIEITTSSLIKVPFISFQNLRSKEFAKLQRDIANCFKPAVLIFKK